MKLFASHPRSFVRHSCPHSPRSLYLGSLYTDLCHSIMVESGLSYYRHLSFPIRCDCRWAGSGFYVPSLASCPVSAGHVAGFLDLFFYLMFLGLIFIKWLILCPLIYYNHIDITALCCCHTFGSTLINIVVLFSNNLNFCFRCYITFRKLSSAQFFWMTLIIKTQHFNTLHLWMLCFCFMLKSWSFKN